MKNKYVCLMDKSVRELYDIENKGIADLVLVRSDELNHVYLLSGFDQSLKEGYIPLSQKDFMDRFPPTKKDVTLFGCRVNKFGYNYYIGSKKYCQADIEGFLKISSDYVNRFRLPMSVDIMTDITKAFNKLNNK